MAAVARIVTSERFAVRGTNLFISNVPGAQVPLYLAGARLVTQYGMAPLANNMGLFVATPSYNGRIAFSIVSERAILPDIAFFRECVEESFADLMQAIPRPQRPKAPTTKAKTTQKAKPRAARPAPAKETAKERGRKSVAKGNAKGDTNGK